jgi:prophage DNA circulation protein
MAWQDTLQDASFRGVPFHVQSVSDKVQRSIGSSEYPYRDGATLEDLGLKAWRFSLKAILWGDDYEGELDALVEALEAKGTGELSHPVWGKLNVMVAEWSTDHEADLVDGVALRIEFVEQGTADPKVFAETSASSEADELVSSAADARDAADAALIRRMADLSDGSALRLSVLKETFEQAKAALTRLTDTSALRAVLSDLDPILYPKAYAADLLAVVDRALQGLPFGGRNLLFDSSSGAQVVAGSGAEDFALVVDRLNPTGIDIEVLADVPNADMLADAAFVRAHACVHAAAAVTDSMAIILAAEAEQTLLDRADLERLANTARQCVQTALDSARSGMDAEDRGRVCAGLQKMATQTLKSTLAVINARPPLVRRVSPVSGPARLVAHALYGAPDRADELVRLNRLGRNVLVNRGEVLNVYAS